MADPVIDAAMNGMREALEQLEQLELTPTQKCQILEALQQGLKTRPLVSDVDALARLICEQATLLRRLEWVALKAGQSACPACKKTQTAGHKKFCPLQRYLKRLRP